MNEHSREGVVLVDKGSDSPASGRGAPTDRKRLVGALVFLVLLSVCFWRQLFGWAVYAAESEVHSYVLLIPLITAYLIHLRWCVLPVPYQTSAGLGSLAAALGGAALAAVKFSPRLFGRSLDGGDVVTLTTLALVCFVVAGGFLFFGSRWIRAAAFPVAFLFLMAPLPVGVVDRLETMSKLASAEAASWFFEWSGTPVLRDHVDFQLPGVAIEVAQECSGIRSSLVLLITSLLAGNLLLRSPWRRAFLALVVVPLGVLRNGFRILVIGLLCSHIGPEMVHHPIHTHGGPLFFALALIPFAAVVWWLRRGERPERRINSP